MQSLVDSVSTKPPSPRGEKLGHKLSGMASEEYYFDRRHLMVISLQFLPLLKFFVKPLPLKGQPNAACSHIISQLRRVAIYNWGLLENENEKL